MIVHTDTRPISTRVIVFTISLFIFTSCLSEYSDHFDAEHSNSPALAEVYHTSTDTDRVWILPDIKIKQELIQSLQAAENRIWLEIYMITDTDVVSELVAAYERGVDVRVILEGNVYGLSYANTRVLNIFKDVGIPVVYADGYQFTFTHAKFWIIDDRYYISTGNITKSFFQSNRDFVFSSDNASVLGFLLELFDRDFAYKTLDRSTIPASIVLSPVDSRAKIEYMLHNAQSHITIYNQTLTDDAILDILRDKKSQGVIIEVCTADNESNREKSGEYSFPWARVKKPYLHAKVIITDKTYLFIGSQNLTHNAIENNRELGIILEKDSVLLPKIGDIIQQDCIFE